MPEDAGVRPVRQALATRQVPVVPESAGVGLLGRLRVMPPRSGPGVVPTLQEPRPVCRSLGDPQVPAGGPPGTGTPGLPAAGLRLPLTTRDRPGRQAHARGAAAVVRGLWSHQPRGAAAVDCPLAGGDRRQAHRDPAEARSGREGCGVLTPGRSAIPVPSGRAGMVV